jgi:hypothetical protein
LRLYAKVLSEEKSFFFSLAFHDVPNYTAVGSFGMAASEEGARAACFCLRTNEFSHTVQILALPAITGKYRNVEARTRHSFRFYVLRKMQMNTTEATATVFGVQTQAGKNYCQ